MELTVKEFADFLDNEKKIVLTVSEKDKVCEARNRLELLLNKKRIYGFNTGVGAFLNQKINARDQEEFQKNILLSHACGTGGFVEEKISRAALFLLIHSLKKGYSGIGLETLEFLIEMHNKGLIPAVPETGSLGASGDLIPLSHLVLPLIGRGLVWFFNHNYGEKVPAAAGILYSGRLKPPKLRAGEALALINGTYFSTAVLALVVHRAKKLCAIADLAAALTMETLGCNTGAFSEKVTNLKYYSGSRASARNLRKLLNGKKCSKSLQDGYSLRCVPQVHGAVRDTLSFAEETAEKEMNSVSSNPVIFPEAPDDAYSNGNFHAQSVAFAADFLGIVLTGLANISERRIERLLNPNLSGLPPFLSSRPGFNSGLMITQYAAVALTARNKVLANPASIHSMPVSAGQEDFVSCAATAGFKAKEILDNTRQVLAIEILCAVYARRFLRKHVKKNSRLAEICDSFEEIVFDEIFGKANLSRNALSQAIENISRYIEKISEKRKIIDFLI